MRSGVQRVAVVVAPFLVWLAWAGVPASGRQGGGAAVNARIARIEQSLLPGILVTGRPAPVMRLPDRMAFHATPGVSIAVINDGAVEWARGYGVAEAGGSTPVTPRTRFQAASISKPVAALGALMLVARGRLSLDEPVNARLTSWKVPENDFTAKAPVTLRRLLSHTAGLTVHGFGGYPAEAPVPTLAQVLDGAKPANSAAIRVDVLPGSINRYSGGGYTVAQQLMVDVAGKPFPALMAELVLRPLGMTDSTYEQPLPARLAGSAASGHRRDGTAIPGHSHTYPEMAAAGLWTTPTDLARFALEVQRALNGKAGAIPAATAREMATEVKDGYGLGLSLSGSGPEARFGHGGSNAGFKCQMTAFVSGGRGAVIMTNGDRGSALAAEIVRAIAREYGWPAFKPVEKTVVPLEAAALAAFEGQYELSPTRVVGLRVIEGKLFVLDGPERVELFAESATKFFDLVQQNSLEFSRGADGEVTGIVINGTTKARRLR